MGDDCFAPAPSHTQGDYGLGRAPGEYKTTLRANLEDGMIGMRDSNQAKIDARPNDIGGTMTLRTLVFYTLVLSGTNSLGQTFFVDFESGHVGDPISSVGLNFDFPIEKVGVNGSNGFEIAYQSRGSRWPSAGARPDLPFTRDGQKLTFGVDVQLSLSDEGNLSPGSPNFVFDLFLSGSINTFGQFLIEDDGNSFTTRNLIPSASSIETGDAVPLSAIGIGDGLVGPSDFFRFEVEIVRNQANGFDYSTSVLDSSGNLLTRN